MQSWWLGPAISRLEAFPLFLGATTLTAVTDNAAITYLGSQLSNISNEFKYAPPMPPLPVSGSRGAASGEGSL
jgi:hypothetical protein